VVHASADRPLTLAARYCTVIPPEGDKLCAMPLDFNHAMIYTRDVARALEFYRDLLGLAVLEEYQAGDRLVYARLKLPAGPATIALHLLKPGETLHTGGVRLYFEVRALENFCKKLEARGVKFSKPPAMMPWGWRHAYLDDPDGHEVSLYWAGPKRLKKVKQTLPGAVC
jgi:catechol 2,3-dioxygenase-like lactoylglutathione lyase family enzyme